MRIPQIAIIVFFSINLLVSARDHGKAKTGTDNFWSAAVATAIIFSLLIWGGFFK